MYFYDSEAKSTKISIFSDFFLEADFVKAAAHLHTVTIALFGKTILSTTHNYIKLLNSSSLFFCIFCCFLCKTGHTTFFLSPKISQLNIFVPIIVTVISIWEKKSANNIV